MTPSDDNEDDCCNTSLENVCVLFEKKQKSERGKNLGVLNLIARSVMVIR